MFETKFSIRPKWLSPIDTPFRKALREFYEQLAAMAPSIRLLPAEQPIERKRVIPSRVGSR